jgi:hypothetical protein
MEEIIGYGIVKAIFPMDPIRKDRKARRNHSEF